MAVQPPARSALWSLPEVTDALDRLSAAGPLTVVVGAGASTESGLPSWPQLLYGLLEDIATERGLADDPVEGASKVADYCTGTLQTEGLLGAAAVVRAALGDQFEQKVLSRLYEGLSADLLLPGPTAYAVAYLRRAWGPSCEVVTLNYDPLLEQAFINIGYAPESVLTVSDGLAYGDDSIVVRHLHGARSPAASDTSRNCGEVVLAERDYHVLTEAAWQEQYFRERLRESTCLYVGVSMSDPNILKFLYREGSEPRHIAVLARLGDGWDAIAPDVRDVRDATTRRRWIAAGVTPLRVDYFVQSAQFLHELTYRRAHPDSFRPYSDRMLEWDSAMRSLLLQEVDVELFRDLQDEVQEELLASLAIIERLIRQDAEPADGERFGLHLWVRDFNNRALVQWSGSDRSWRDPRTLNPIPIAMPSHWVAVEGFCRGYPVSRDTGETTSRWDYIRAFPIILEGTDPESLGLDERWGRLPVGVATLASTLGGDGSALARLSPGTVDEIRLFLAPVLRHLLTPAVDQ